MNLKMINAERVWKDQINVNFIDELGTTYCACMGFDTETKYEDCSFAWEMGEQRGIQNDYAEWQEIENAWCDEIFVLDTDMQDECGSIEFDKHTKETLTDWLIGESLSNIEWC